MGGSERIEIAFGAPGETRQAAILPQGSDAVPPASEYLVGIALMTDVPDEPVMRCVKHMMQGDGQFDDTEACTQMSTGLGNRVDHLCAQLRGQLRKLTVVQRAQIRHLPDRVEEGSVGLHIPAVFQTHLFCLPVASS